MKLKTCMEIGKSCGLTKIEECYDNIYLHSSMIFKYQDINKEIEELQRDIFYHEPDLFCKIFNALLLCFIRFSVTLNKIDAC